MGMPMPPAGANPDDLLAAYASRAMSPTGEPSEAQATNLSAAAANVRQSVVSETSAYSAANAHVVAAYEDDQETGVAK